MYLYIYEVYLIFIIKNIFIPNKLKKINSTQSLKILIFLSIGGGCRTAAKP